MGKRTVAAVLWVLLTLSLTVGTIQARSPSLGPVSDQPSSAHLFPASLYPLPMSLSDPSAEAKRALAYVAEGEGIKAENLVIVNEFQRDALLLGRTFQAVTLLDLSSGRFFRLLVDRQSGQVENAATVEMAEEHAHQDKYGKLQAALYERLETMQDDEMVMVMIWAAAGPGQSLAEREAAARTALAAKHPEVQTALEYGGKPTDVDDPELADRVYSEYVDLLDAEPRRRVQPLVVDLQALGYVVRTDEGLPALTAVLPKKTILLLATREDIGTILLAEGGQRHPVLDSAVPTDRAPGVWKRGYVGNGTIIAILEDDNVDFTSDSAEC